MTNGEKFLRDGVSVEDFIRDLGNQKEIMKVNMNTGFRSVELNDLDNWLSRQLKPTLTEDERVILKNIDKIFKYIGRTKNGTLFLRIEMFSKTDDRAFHFYNHLFQFIKEGEEYSIEELLKGE